MAQVECGHWDQRIRRWDSDLLISLGPSIKVDIGFDTTFDPVQWKNIPKADIQDILALIDTGAQESFIDDGLAGSLNLPLVDRVRLSGISGHHMAAVYSAQMFIPSLKFLLVGRFAGVDLIAGGLQHMALIGRTFLTHHKMTYDGMTGRVVLSD